MMFVRALSRRHRRRVLTIRTKEFGMQRSKHNYYLLAATTALGLVLSGCGGGTTDTASGDGGNTWALVGTSGGD